MTPGIGFDRYLSRIEEVAASGDADALDRLHAEYGRDDRRAWRGRTPRAPVGVGALEEINSGKTPATGEPLALGSVVKYPLPTTKAVSMANPNGKRSSEPLSTCSDRTAT